MNIKTTKTIGMSVAYGIGSDSYHEIIVDLKRNGRTIITTRADVILNCAEINLEQWNELTAIERQEKTIAFWNQMMADAIVHELSYGDTDIETATRWAMNQIGRTYTLRADGSYRSQGNKYGCVRFNSQREYQSPEF
jgi:hypothetical protein